MPPFDFPASPAVGEVSNGYQWTGEMWGGAPKLGTDMSEQFFDLTGLSSLDIQVPVWAKGVQLIGNCYLPTNASNTMLLRVSADGSTFFSGASDYYNIGCSHNTGSSGYMTNQSATGTGIVLTLSGQDPVFPHSFTAEMTLVRPASPSQIFLCKTYGKSQDTAASTMSRTVWWEGWLSTAVTTALALKALRLFNFGGTACLAGSWLKVKWLGDIAQVPPSTGIADAPSDGCEYVRVNGIWRKKSQTFVLDGIVNFDLAVPDGAKAMRVYSTMMPPPANATSSSVCFRASIDGTNFMAGASDYHYAGFIHYSGASGFSSLNSVVGAFNYLAFNNDAAIVQEVIDWRQTLIRPTVPSNQPWYGMVNSTSYQTTAANAYNNAQMRVGVMNTSAGVVTTLKALRIYRANGGAFGSPSLLEASWIY